VTGLLTENERVRGVKIQHGGYLYGAGEVEVEAKVVIAADGVEAQIGRWAGLSNTLPLKDRMVCVQYLLAGVEIDPTCTSYVIDNDIAPGGYAWVFPKGNAKANVGLGVQADIWEKLVDQNSNNSPPKVGEGTVLEFLTRFIESDSDLEKGFPVTLITGNVPVAPPAKSLVKDGLMLVGDAARQVDPLTGGGIINAMTAGRLAAQVAVNAIAEGNTSSSKLKQYETIWQQTTGRKLLRNYRLREKFPPLKRTDKRFMRAFALAVGG
jgi:digeranylgeranylglycerophospholipid reductase